MKRQGSFWYRHTTWTRASSKYLWFSAASLTIGRPCSPCCTQTSSVYSLSFRRQRCKMQILMQGIIFTKMRWFPAVRGRIGSSIWGRIRWRQALRRVRGRGNWRSSNHSLILLKCLKYRAMLLAARSLKSLSWWTFWVFSPFKMIYRKSTSPIPVATTKNRSCMPSGQDQGCTASLSLIPRPSKSTRRRSLSTKRTKQKSTCPSASCNTMAPS